MVEVLIIGHSNTPKVYSYDDVNITFVKKGGAVISDLYHHDLWPLVFGETWDIVIIFLGGNDLCFMEPNEVVSSLMEVVDQLKCTKQVYLTLIETRVYSEEKSIKYNITTEEYNHKAKNCSRMLSRQAQRTNKFRTINCCPSYHYNSPEGIHFGEEAKISLISKYLNAIQYA